MEKRLVMWSRYFDKSRAKCQLCMYDFNVCMDWRTDVMHIVAMSLHACDFLNMDCLCSVK